MGDAGNWATIGPMREHQVETIARLRCSAFFEGSDRTVAEDAEDLRGLLRDGVFETALAAEIGGAAVGSCLFVRNELEPAHDLTPWLAGLVVAPGWRGRGFGRDLVRAVERHAARVGCAKLHLYTGAAEPFYAALGWQVDDRFIDHGEAMVLMSRRLEEERTVWRR